LLKITINHTREFTLLIFDRTLLNLTSERSSESKCKYLRPCFTVILLASQIFFETSSKHEFLHHISASFLLSLFPENCSYRTRIQLYFESNVTWRTRLSSFRRTLNCAKQLVHLVASNAHYLADMILPKGPTIATQITGVLASATTAVITPMSPGHVNLSKLSFIND